MANSWSWWLFKHLCFTTCVFWTFDSWSLSGLGQSHRDGGAPQVQAALGALQRRAQEHPQPRSQGPEGQPVSKPAAQGKGLQGQRQRWKGVEPQSATAGRWWIDAVGQKVWGELWWDRLIQKSVDFWRCRIHFGDLQKVTGFEGAEAFQ